MKQDSAQSVFRLQGRNTFKSFIQPLGTFIEQLNRFLNVLSFSLLLALVSVLDVNCNSGRAVQPSKAVFFSPEDSREQYCIRYQDII